MNNLLRRESEGLAKDTIRSIKVGAVILSVSLVVISAAYAEPRAQQVMHFIRGGHPR